MLKRLVFRLVSFCGKRPWVVLLLALGCSAAAWAYASRIELHTDLLELLPRDSPGFKAFEKQLGKLGGGATLLAIVESPDRAANRRFIDALGEKLHERAAKTDACLKECSGDRCGACGPRLIQRVEAGTREVHDYFQRNRWLYASVEQLRQADADLDEAIATESGLVDDLESEDPEPNGTKGGGSSTDAARAPADPSPDKGPRPEKDAVSALVDRTEARFRDAETKLNPAPSGYFETPDGKSAGLRIIANSTAMGDASGDQLLADVQALVRELGPSRYHPEAVVGYAGDIPNSIDERQSLASDALVATAAALALILGGIVLYFRSLASLFIVGMPVVAGVGFAYAFATATYGYVNSTGAFLGAIILGNGINYPIVLLSRYEEFVARGQKAEEARKNAVWNAFRAELVGAAVASIAYGSLTVTRFRGFSQFGTIGCAGMLFVWLTTIAVVPALLAIVERRRECGRWMGEWGNVHTRAGGPAIRWLSRFTARRRLALAGLSAAVFASSVIVLPKFLRDPWEYNFDHLGSRGSKNTGAGLWSLRAERVFGGKSNVSGAMMLAESPEQALAIKRVVLAENAADPKGPLLDDVYVVQDFLPGSAAEQREKLPLLASLRRRVTPRVLASLSETARAKVAALLPATDLRELGAADLPTLLRAQFQDRAGRLGTVFYVRYRDDVSLSDGKVLLRIAALTDDVALPDGTRVQTASRATIFAEMIRSMERDGPLASAVAFLAVVCVVLVATRNRKGALTVLSALVLGVTVMLGHAAACGERLNFLNFIAIPITLGIGCEYPFNIYDRSRLLGGDVAGGLERAGMAVALCSYTTIIGYGSLLFADNQALQSFGRLAIRGEITCVLAALLMLPAVLHIFSAVGAQPHPSETPNGHPS